MKTRTVFTILLTLIIPLFAYGNNVNNPSMEGAFILQAPGYVAEYWSDFGSGSGSYAQGSYAHDGSKSQQISWDGLGYESFGPDGIYQQISSLQPGQSYRVSVWFKFRFEAMLMMGWASGEMTFGVGIDPNGGTDPAMVDNWDEVTDYGYEYYEGPWLNVVTFFSPNDTTATLFIKASGYGDAMDEVMPGYPEPAYWDAYCYIDDVVVTLAEIGDASTVEATSPVPANGANHSEITITVLDTNGDPIPGIPASEITVNCTGSGNTIIGPDQPTDGNGRTTAKITSTVAETKTVSAAVSGTLLSDTALVEFGPAYFGPEWHVDASNTGYGNGSPEYPFRTISDAIIPAQDGDTVVVQQGIYYENVDFSGRAITIRNTNPEDWSIVKATVIDANGSGSAVSFNNNENRDSVISGFTITGGNTSYGGGIYCKGSPIITNNIITDNIASSGGGGVYGYNSTYYRPRIHNNIIANNLAAYGAGVQCRYGIIANCFITSNSTTSSYGDGAGLYDCDGTIVNCTITANNANDDGGGLYICNGTIKNCIIWNNTAGGDGNQLYSCSDPTYSCIQDWSGGGVGNISYDPLFADANSGDYHLLSAAGRWDPSLGDWVIDVATSPCIDGGDPLSRLGIELNPNGGRINMGFYGGTIEASKSTSGIVETVCTEYPATDFNKDCKVDFEDFAVFALSWLECNLDPPEACW